MGVPIPQFQPDAAPVSAPAKTRAPADAAAPAASGDADSGKDGFATVLARAQTDPAATPTDPAATPDRTATPDPAKPVASRDAGTGLAPTLRFERAGIGAFNARLASGAAQPVASASTPALQSTPAAPALENHIGRGTGFAGLSASMLALLGATADPDGAPADAASAPDTSSTSTPAVPVQAVASAAVLPVVTTTQPVAATVVPPAASDAPGAAPASLFERVAAKTGSRLADIAAPAGDTSTSASAQALSPASPSGADLPARDLPALPASDPATIAPAAPAQTLQNAAPAPVDPSGSQPVAAKAHVAVPLSQLHDVIVREARQLTPDAPREFTIRLDPASLGRIDVKLDVKADGYVTAVVEAQHASTFDLLRQNARGLEQSLTNAGLKTDQGALAFTWRENLPRSSGQPYAGPAAADEAVLADTKPAAPARRWFNITSRSRVDISA